MPQSNNSLLHTLETDTGNVEVMMHHKFDGGVSVMLGVRDNDESASVSIAPSQARAVAALLVVAAEQAEARIARGVAA
jgi:hypothetical protein